MKTACIVSGLVTLAIACGGSSATVGPGDPAEGPDVAEDVNDLTSTKVTLRVPILAEDKKPLARHNDQLAAAGLGTFPTTVEVEGDKAKKKFIVRGYQVNALMGVALCNQSPEKVGAAKTQLREWPRGRKQESI